MTMIEKVANAIDREWCEWQRTHDQTIYSNVLRNKMARAAIEAMREPTEAMLSNIRPSLLPRDVWQAMIDAALKQ